MQLRSIQSFRGRLLKTLSLCVWHTWFSDVWLCGGEAGTSRRSLQLSKILGIIVDYNRVSITYWGYI